MRIHCLRHAPFEGPGNIARWAAARGHDLQSVRLYEQERLPDLPEFDLLVVMGGPMSVHDEAAYPWLIPEKKLIERCLAACKFTLGVCLGSQLLAEALGARVYRNRFKEIGWLPVNRCAEAPEANLLQTLPREFTVFQWHGETYDLPAGTTHLARSEACAVQAFEQPAALGLQFHLEMTLPGISGLVRECAADIGSGPYEQTPGQMLAAEDQCAVAETLLAGILDGIEARIGISTPH